MDSSSSPATSRSAVRRSRRTPTSRCVICCEAWPQNFIVLYGEHHLCCRCHVKLKDPTFRKRHREVLKKYRIRRSVSPKVRVACWAAFAVIVFASMMALRHIG